MIVQFVQFETSFTEEETLAVARERMAAYAAIPGLLQKYYLKLSKPNHYAGVMIWDSQEALQAFQASDLAKTVPTAYGVIGAPDVDIHELMFPLRQGVLYADRHQAA